MGNCYTLVSPRPPTPAPSCRADPAAGLHGAGHDRQGPPQPPPNNKDMPLGKMLCPWAVVGVLQLSCFLSPGTPVRCAQAPSKGTATAGISQPQAVNGPRARLPGGISCSSRASGLADSPWAAGGGALRSLPTPWPLCAAPCAQHVEGLGSVLQGLLPCPWATCQQQQ